MSTENDDDLLRAFGLDGDERKPGTRQERPIDRQGGKYLSQDDLNRLDANELRQRSKSFHFGRPTVPSLSDIETVAKTLDLIAGSDSDDAFEKWLDDD